MACSRGCCSSPAEHYRSVGVDRGRARSVDATERRWHSDMPAYQRLKGDGFQPDRIDGCARIEGLAETRCEVDMGRIVHNREERVRTQEIFSQVTGPITTPKEAV